MHPELCIGGAEKVLLNLLQAFDRTKYKVTIVLRNPAIWDKLIPTDVSVRYLFHSKPTVGRFKARFYKYALIFCPNLIYKLFGDSGKYDIAIAYHEPMIWYLPSIKADKRISWVHSDYSVRKVSPEVKTMVNQTGHLAQLIEKKRKNLIHSFDKIVFVAQTCIPSYIQFNHITKDKCTVVHNINNEKEVLSMSNEPIEDDCWNDYKGHHLIIVGRIHHEKAMHRLIPLMIHIKEVGIDAKIYIIGDGNERIKLEQLITAHHLQNHFYILGFQSNPYKYIKNAKLLLCCSPSEAYCTTTKEALLLETPIITTLCSGMEEQIGDTHAGIIVPQGDDTLYPAVSKVLTNDEYYQKMKADARLRHIALSDKQSLKEFDEFIEHL